MNAVLMESIILGLGKKAFAKNMEDFLTYRKSSGNLERYITIAT